MEFVEEVKILLAYTCDTNDVQESYFIELNPDVDSWRRFDKNNFDLLEGQSHTKDLPKGSVFNKISKFSKKI